MKNNKAIYFVYVRSEQDWECRVQIFRKLCVTELKRVGKIQALRILQLPQPISSRNERKQKETLAT